EGRLVRRRTVELVVDAREVAPEPKLQSGVLRGFAAPPFAGAVRAEIVDLLCASGRAERERGDEPREPGEAPVHRRLLLSRSPIPIRASAPAPAQKRSASGPERRDSEQMPPPALPPASR